MLQIINNTKALLKNAWMQRSLIIIILIITFWHGLWAGVPRADQIVFLHQIGQFQNLLDIILNAPSWNRTQSGGDYILYRPILYLQLGSFYFFFGYDFFKWQLASLALHVIVVLGVHSLLSFGRFHLTFFPILLALCFGVSLLGSELVLWNHIAGYILFSIFLVYSIFFLGKYLDTKKESYAWLSLILGTLSEFTYEFGVIFNMFIVLFFCYKQHLINPLKNDKSKKSIKYIKWICLFSLSVLFYPLFSILDLLLNGFHEIPADGHAFSISSLFMASYFAIKQILFWMAGWVLPTAYDIQAGARAGFYGLKLGSLSFLVNLIIVLTLLVILYANKRMVINKNKEVMLIAFGALFLFFYSFIIAYGRAIPKGIYHVLTYNIYYSYIAYLIVIVTVAMFALVNKSKYFEANSIANKNRGLKASKSILYFCFSLLVLFNACDVFKLSKSLRYEYSEPRMELIAFVSSWLATQGKNSTEYFSVSPACEGGEPMPWFDEKHIRKNKEWKPVLNLIDALFPEKSFNLNKHKSLDEKFSVLEIKCQRI